MNKLEFNEKLSGRLAIPVYQAEVYTNTFIGLIYEMLNSGDVVNLSGFGKFSISHRASRIGHNPKTAQPMTIPEFNSPKFKAGKAFKDAVKLK